MSEFPRIFAHRGASSLAPENTIAAFSKAMEVGARWFEFDVDITGDGSLIVIHDDTLDRTTTGSGSYYQLGFSDIRRLDAGRWFSDTYRFERIPEATDVLAFAHAQQMGANLEIKPCAGGDRLRERLIEALRAAHLGEFFKSLPGGLDARVGARGLAVSGGEAQRIAIARAFLKNASIMILDEPTAHVDLASEREILASLETVCAGRTTLTISHRDATIKGADRVATLQEGTIR